MTIAILDPAAGISGDMTLGALLDVGVAPDWLESLPARLGFPDVRIRVQRVDRAAVTATKVEFDMPHAGGHGGHGMHVAELVELVERAAVSASVRRLAVQAFQLIGEAEGRVHGVPPERVHLHEVGAIDAVLDFVGVFEGFEQLGVDRVYHRPVAVGSGWVEAAHGKLPLPAPATALLLEGLEIVHGGPVEGEATTPTGAAILRVLSAGAPPARWRMLRSGWGAGTRNPGTYPNALRLIVGEAAVEAGELDIVTTDVDDLSPEYVEPVRQAAFGAGAVECVVWPTQGKKGRVSLRIEALAPPDRSDAVADALFRHSTTAGVRQHRVIRRTLPRREVTVTLGDGTPVRIKVWEGPDGFRCKAEYDDVVAAAERLGRPALAVARDAERRAEVSLANGRSDA